MPSAMAFARPQNRETRSMMATGYHSVSEKSTLPRVCIIEMPMTTRTGAVAAVGIIRNSGARNMERRNSRPVTTEVKPVRPPASTPEADST